MASVKREVNIDVDIGLGILCVLFPEGAFLTWREIADICECNQTLIKAVEIRAIKKLRKKLKIENFDLV